MGGNPNGGSLGGVASSVFRVSGRSSRPSLATQSSGSNGVQRSSLVAISDECLPSASSSSNTSSRDGAPGSTSGERELSAAEAPLSLAQQENLFRMVLEASLSTEVGLIVLDLVCQFATTFKVCSRHEVNCSFVFFSFFRSFRL